MAQKKIKKSKKAKPRHKGKRIRSRGSIQNPEVQKILHLAIHQQQSGQLQQAEQLYRKVLEKDPYNVNAYNQLGVLAKQVRQHDKAVSFFRKALKIDPRFAGALYNLGNTLKEKGELNEAVSCYGKCIVLDPGFIEAHISFALLLENSFSQISCETDPFYRKALIDCFGKNFVDHQDINNAVLAFLLNKGVEDSINSFLKSGNNEFLFTDKKLSSFLSDRLFLMLLRKTINTSLLVEKFLTKVRKTCLLLISSGHDPESLPKHIKNLIFSMAHQCFWNEYIFYELPEEKKAKKWLIAEIQKNTTIKPSHTPLLIALLGCYTPLGLIRDFIDTTKPYSDQNFDDLIKIQVIQPSLEQKLKSEIVRLRDISNDISQLVQQQYEENPYPRWISFYRPKPINFILYLQLEIYPNKVKQPIHIKDRPDILLSGCGTGLHPVSVAQTYKGANILAVDLSLASLAYAKRKAIEFGINNIDFAQADILDLHRLDKKFDVIECVGVLHHMGKPIDGWRILATLLKPGGFMKIGLYSKHARKHIATAREFIRKFDYDPSPDGIRECRKQIVELPGDSSMKKELTKSKNFYSASAIRDLIFHAQEHCFTLPEISVILENLELSMMGFAIDSHIKKHYLSQFSDDPNATSIIKWDQYENENPDTFQGMYQFWLQKNS